MVAKPVNIGVLGYGHYGRVSWVRQMRQCRSLNIVGVYNRGEERRRQAEEDGFWVTGDLDELLGRSDVEAVMIATYNEVHRDHAVAAARAGKHMICEKPLALSCGHVDDMANAVEEAGVISHVNHTLPYETAFEKFHQLVKKHCGQIMQIWIRTSRHFGTWKVGARHRAVGHPEASGGWTYHHFCHSLNAACLLAEYEKHPPISVYHVEQKSCDEAPSEELVTSIIRFENGITAQLNDGTTIGGFGDIGVNGTDADARLLGDTVSLVRPGESDPRQRPGNLSPESESFQVSSTGGKQLHIIGDIFAEAVRTGDTDRLISFQWVRNQYRILEAMKKSAETGEVVHLT